MNSRVLKLKVLTQNELVKVETSARTFGELKKEDAVMALGIDWTSAKLIDRASKASFEIDEAVLPATDAVMFVMPTKSKAGASYQAELRAKIKQLKEDGVEVPFNYTHATNSQMEAFLASVETVEEETPCTEELEVITLKPGKYILQVDGYDNEEVEEVELLDQTTLNDLEDEAQMLMGKF